MLDSRAYDALAGVLSSRPALAIAVSGGVDSLTLSALACKIVPDVILFHASSAAVPTEATERLLRLSAEHDWHLETIDAGEVADERYRSNPVNRCFYCKQNLYTGIRKHTSFPIASGTNTDDLADFRPGLDAASEAGVIHPFVEAGFSKAMVRQLAASLGLEEVSALPASPCLSSRVRTGVAIEPVLLRLIDEAEALIRRELEVSEDVRCRIHASHMLIQLPADSPGPRQQAMIEASLEQLFADTPWAALCDRIEWGVYLKGSAFATDNIMHRRQSHV